MFLSIIKLVVVSSIVAFSSWLAGKKPELAGFIIAMPIASLLALAFSYLENRNDAASITFAKSILIGVPVSWLFFLPFFLAERFGLSFWLAYVLGLLLLIAGYFIHRFIMGFL